MNKLNLIQKKIVDTPELERMLAIWNFKGKKIVFANGCFDLIHRGHIEFLGQSASEGNILIIGLHSDESVRRLKGDGRPIQDFQTRAMILSSFQFVDAVVKVDDDTPLEIIKLIKPDVLVKGADRLPKDIVGFDVVSARNGKVMTIEMIKGQSTDVLFEKIRG